MEPARAPPPFPPLRRDRVGTLQVNLGYRCNQSCLHCHVNAGPTRTEVMSRETVTDVLAFLGVAGVKRLDGQFDRGDAVVIRTIEGRELGRGLIAYTRADADQIIGKRSAQIPELLGHEGRTELMDDNKARYARKTDARKLADVIGGADVFLGLSAGKVLSQDLVKTMGKSPLILALANPEPEIQPDLAKAVRPDAVIATGRSDFPNQVNNVLCFPFIFRGALDVGATQDRKSTRLNSSH